MSTNTAAEVLMEQSGWVHSLAMELGCTIVGMRGKAEELEMHADALEKTKTAYEQRAERLFLAAEDAEGLTADRDEGMGAEYLSPYYGSPLVEVQP